MMKTTIILAALVLMMAVSSNALFWPAPKPELVYDDYEYYDDGGYRRESPKAPKNIFDIIFGFLRPQSRASTQKRVARAAPQNYRAGPRVLPAAP